jgi:hypothetical protein
VVERLAARLGGADVDAQVLEEAALSDELVEAAGTQRLVEAAVGIVALGAQDWIALQG